jgi:hypothetical protein
MNSQFAREVKDGVAKYAFVCEGCGAIGDLGVPLDTTGTFGCPEGCGTTYIQYKDLGAKWALMCVVRPVFEGPEGADG